MFDHWQDDISRIQAGQRIVCRAGYDVPQSCHPYFHIFGRYNRPSPGPPGGRLDIPNFYILLSAPWWFRLATWGVLGQSCEGQRDGEVGPRSGRVQQCLLSDFGLSSGGALKTDSFPEGHRRFYLSFLGSACDLRLSACPAEPMRFFALLLDALPGYRKDSYRSSSNCENRNIVPRLDMGCHIVCSKTGKSWALHNNYTNGAN